MDFVSRATLECTTCSTSNPRASAPGSPGPRDWCQEPSLVTLQRCHGFRPEGATNMVYRDTKIHVTRCDLETTPKRPKNDLKTTSKRPFSPKRSISGRVQKHVDLAPHQKVQGQGLLQQLEDHPPHRNMAKSLAIDNTRPLRMECSPLSRMYLVGRWFRMGQHCSSTRFWLPRS